MRDQDAAHVAVQLWSSPHGYGTLELSGHFGQLDGPTPVFVAMGVTCSSASETPPTVPRTQ